jgi:hypothetical protein
MPMGSWGLSIICRQQATRGLLVLLLTTPGLCRAAYDPPQIHITPQDMQALVQCYLDASGGEALSVCDKRAVMIEELKRKRAVIEESLRTTKVAPELRGSLLDRSAFGVTVLLTVLTLLCSVAWLRRFGKLRYETDPLYGDTPCP